MDLFIPLLNIRFWRKKQELTRRFQMREKSMLTRLRENGRKCRKCDPKLPNCVPDEVVFVPSGMWIHASGTIG